jgi:short-subunit dehydrogenase
MLYLLLQINNAGILLIGIDTTFETVKPVFDTNYFGVKNVTKALLPLLRDDTPGGARVIVVASRAGQLKVTCLGILVPTATPQGSSFVHLNEILSSFPNG